MQFMDNQPHEKNNNNTFGACDGFFSHGRDKQIHQETACKAAY
jgi:hypothetical protein